MKWSWFIAGTVFLCIAFAIWYHIPIKHEQHYTLSTYQDEEKTTTITLNVTKHRKFFRETVLSGELIHENQVYASVDLGHGSSWLNKFQGKLSGDLAPGLFISTEDNGRTAISRDKWHLYGGKDDLSLLTFFFQAGVEDETLFYVAPANNRAEALKLLKEND